MSNTVKADSMSSRIDGLRDEDGTLPAFAWPGGYPIVYYTRQCDELCADCANNESEPPAVDGDVYWEGPTIQCSDCGKDIESAYGDPDARNL